MAAESGFQQICFISTLLLCLLSSSSVYSTRNLAENEILLLLPKTSVLDISTSIQKTLDILLSFESKTLQQSIQSFDSSSEYTLQLNSRDTLDKSSAKDYTSLTLARLKRDSARVRSLNIKLDLAIKGIKKSDLKPLEEEEEVEGLEEAAENDFESPITAGLRLGSGEYFTRIGIGSPPQSFYMVIDTGSDVTWLQCDACTDCYQQTDPLFKPSSSSSYSALPCGSEQCQLLDVSACRNESCLYQVSYGDGSFTVGNFATETLTFDNSASISKISLGCGHDNEGLFIAAAGILALGGGKLSFVTQSKSSFFSYCLVDRDSSSSSSLEIGSSSLSMPPDSITTTRLLKNPKIDTFYYVDIIGMSVGGQTLPIPASLFQLDSSGSGGVIIDSGTSVTRLRSDIYNVLRDTFKSGTTHLPSADAFALFDTCYDLSSMGSSVQVPTVAFLFPGGKSLMLPAKNYLIPVASNKTFCFAFAGTRSSLSIIGNLQQQGTRVSFDIGKSVIGFSPNKC